jgi:hypothetical protein
MKLIYLNTWDNLDLGEYRILLFGWNNIYLCGKGGVLFIQRNIFLVKIRPRRHLFFSNSGISKKKINLIFWEDLYGI